MATVNVNTNILLETGTNELEIIELYIEEENGYRGYYGVNVAKVVEIISMPEKVVKPPNSADFVRGIFNHRGKVIMLLDLAHWLGRTQQAANIRPIVIITEFNNVVSAFLVSGVTRIHRTTWANIKPVDEYMLGNSEAVTGVIILEGRTVLMLDLEKIISDLDPRLAIPQEAPEDASDAAITDENIVYPIKVLHADDSSIIRRSTKQLLESKGEFAVESFQDGAMAWTYLEGIKKRAVEEKRSVTEYLQIVVSDIEMPEMDGYSLCMKIKGDPVLKILPVCLFSSLITDKLLHKGQSVGADAQLVKPSEAELFRKLKDLYIKHRK